LTKYIVKHSVLSLRGNSKYQGEELSSDELEGIDIDRLIGLGAIEIRGEEQAEQAISSSVEAEEEQPVKLDRMNKQQLEDYADSIGLQLNPDAMKRDDMIQAIKDHEKAEELFTADDGSGDWEPVRLEELADGVLKAVARKLELEVEPDVTRDQLIESIAAELLEQQNQSQSQSQD
jgi:hypothetical protein